MSPFSSPVNVIVGRIAVVLKWAGVGMLGVVVVYLTFCLGRAYNVLKVYAMHRCSEEEALERLAGGNQARVTLTALYRLQLFNGLRPSMIRLLGECGCGGKAVLHGALRDKDPEVRIAAIIALQKLETNGDKLLEGLRPLLADRNDDVRSTACYALESCGVDAVPDLIDALADPNEQIKLAATQALRRIGHGAAPLLAQALSHSSPVVREGAAHALGTIGQGDQNVIRELARLLNDANGAVRAAAAQALGQTGKEATPALDQLLSLLREDREPYVRQCCIFAVNRISPAGSMNALGNALSDVDPDVRAKAAEALGLMAQRAHPEIPRLELAMRDGSPSVRAAAAIAIVRIMPERKNSILGFLRNDPARTDIDIAVAIDELR